MSFGLVNVLVTFQKFVNQILRKKLDNKVLTYINDIFIIKKTKKEHRERTRKTLKKLLIIRLKIKLFKSKFEKKKVKFLKHIIGREKIKLNSEKIKTLKE